MSNYTDIIKEAFTLGGLEMLRAVQPKLDEISQRQAYNEFGKAFVKDAVDDGRIEVIRKGSGKNSKKVYSRAQLRRILAERNILRDIIENERDVPRMASATMPARVLNP